MYAAAMLWRARKAEETVRVDLRRGQGAGRHTDAKISEQSASLKTIADAKKVSDQNLQRAQVMVDQLITQLVQLPTGNDFEVAFSRQQLNDAAAYVMQGLPALEKDAALAPERARAYGNLGMIHLKQRKSADAAQFLDKARMELHALLARDPESPHASLYHQWLGRFSLLLANMRAARGDEETAMILLKEATTNLDPGIEANPKDRNVRFEPPRPGSATACAAAWKATTRKVPMPRPARAARWMKKPSAAPLCRKRASCSAACS